MSAGMLVMVKGQKEPRKMEWGALTEAEANHRTAGWRPLPEPLPRAEQGPGDSPHEADLCHHSCRLPRLEDICA